jgi:hypothetical protein
MPTGVVGPEGRRKKIYVVIQVPYKSVSKVL